jgi:hypothetical protein
LASFAILELSNCIDQKWFRIPQFTTEKVVFIARVKVARYRKWE